MLAERIEANQINTKDLTADNEFVKNLVASSGFIENLKTSKAFIESLEANSATIASVTVKQLDTQPDKTGNKITIKDNDFIVYDSNGYKKVLINSDNIGGYDNVMHGTTYNGTNSQDKTISVSMNSYSAFSVAKDFSLNTINLGYFDKNSTISIDSVSVSGELLMSGSSQLRVYHSGANWGIIQLLCNGSVVYDSTQGKAIQKIFGSATSPSTTGLSITVNVDLDYTVQTDGTYQIVVKSYPSTSSSWITFSPTTTTTSIQTGSYTITTSVTFSFSRSNSTYVHIGKDGISQMTPTSYFYSGVDTFVVNISSVIFKINKSGIMGSINGGKIFTSLLS